MINGRTNGRSLESPEFDPILSTAEELRVPIYLHPAMPSRAVQAEYYEGFGSIVSTRLASAALGWHFETGVHALSMVLGGVFDRHPELQIILGHWGELLPAYFERIDQVLGPYVEHLERPVADYLASHFYVTPSGMYSLPNLQLALATLGSDRIMFAVDYPYISAAGARDFLEAAPISQADRAKIAHGNAERLLKLRSRS